MAEYEYKIGTTSGNMVYLETLVNKPPRSVFTEWPVVNVAADGKTNGEGLSTTTWSFDYLTETELASLRGYCTGKSAAVYIKTRKADNTFATYTAIMHWPQDQMSKRGWGAYQDFSIEFTHLQVVS